MPRGYVRNPSFQASDLLEGNAEFFEKRVEVADAVVEFARLAAPESIEAHVLKSGYVNKPGDYKRGLRTVVHNGKVYASGTDWKSHWVEFGIPSRKIEPKAPLRRGAQAVGLKLKSKRR